MSRTRMSSRLSIFSGACTFIALVGGCLQHPVVAPEPSSAQEEDAQIDLIINKDVDVLFVLDNSGSMGEEQGALAVNFPSFVSVLEEKDVDANYRMAVVTTDMDPQICRLEGSATEGTKKGDMALTSCETRPTQFSKQQATKDEDFRYNTACNVPCEIDKEDLEVLPTKLQDGEDLENAEEPKARPWLQRTDGASNLANDVDRAKAFQCFAPQGIRGCGLEQHLESLHSAIKKAGDPKSTNYGFFREKAITAIVLVTDELDCSYNPDIGGKIFDRNQHTDGNGDFWPESDGIDYTANYACLKAGVECDGSGGDFDCEVADFDINRKRTDDPDKAVLYPVQKYIDEVQAIEDKKKDGGQVDQELIVALIGGVEIKADGSSSNPVYNKTDIPEQVHKFGELDFGCRSNSATEAETNTETMSEVPAGSVVQEAMPPVRLAKFVRAFQDEDSEETGMYSICSNDFSKPLRNIADKIRSQIKPACYSGCVLDEDPTTEVLEPICTVTETKPASTPEPLKECDKDDGEYIVDADGNFKQPDTDSKVCYAMLWDKGGVTDGQADDIDEICLMKGNNLQFKLQRVKGSPAPANTRVRATCQLTDDPAECAVEDYEIDLTN